MLTSSCSRTKCPLRAHFAAERGVRVQMHLSKVISILLLVSLSQFVSASQFYCQKGDPVTADIGDGVIMQTCMWENSQAVVVRVGPLELIKNGILILKTQTNSKGKLHGPFTSWSDHGEILEMGQYFEGLKEGNWITTNEDGNKKAIQYKKGVPIEP